MLGKSSAILRTINGKILKVKSVSPDLHEATILTKSSSINQDKTHCKPLKNSVWQTLQRQGIAADRIVLLTPLYSRGVKTHLYRNLVGQQLCSSMLNQREITKFN